MLEEDVRITTRNRAAALIAVWVTLAVLIAQRYPGESSRDQDDLGLLASFGAILAYLTIRYERSTFRTLLNPSSNLLLRRVKEWQPKWQGLVAEEMHTSPLFRAAKRWAVTKNFVVRRTWFTADASCFDELLWHYKRKVQHNVNGIDAGTTEGVVLHFTDAIVTLESRDTLHGMVRRWVASLLARKTLAPTRDAVSHTQRYLSERAPWAFEGYSDQLDSRYRTDPEGFAREVFARRRDPEAKRRNDVASHRAPSSA